MERFIGLPPLKIEGRPEQPADDIDRVGSLSDETLLAPEYDWDAFWREHPCGRLKP